MSKIEVDTVEPQSGTSLTLGASGDTITIPAGATFDSSAATTTLPATVVTTTGTQTLSNKTIDATQLTGTVATSNLGTGTADATTFLRGDQTYAAAGGANTPMFFASSGQTIADTTTTKLTLTEIYDVTSTYATGTFTPGVAGKYYMFGQIFIAASYMNIFIYKNGSNFADARFNNGENTDNVVQVHLIDEANDTDYYEMYAYQSSGGSASSEGGTRRTYFGGYKIIE